MVIGRRLGEMSIKDYVRGENKNGREEGYRKSRSVGKVIQRKIKKETENLEKEGS